MADISYTVTPEGAAIERRLTAVPAADPAVLDPPPLGSTESLGGSPGSASDATCLTTRGVSKSVTSTWAPLVLTPPPGPSQLCRKVVIVGGEVTALALALRLAGRGIAVQVFDGGLVGATARNQRWKHSGLIQKTEDGARELWRAFKGMAPVERRCLTRKGGHLLFDNADNAAERERTWRAWGIPYWGLDGDALKSALAGFGSPDSVIDFSRLAEDLRLACAQRGVLIHRGALVASIVRDGRDVVGVVGSTPDSSRAVFTPASHVVLAAGQWAPELLATAGVAVAVARWKSHIVTLEGEWAPGVVAWLDGTGLTAVPFEGRTLFSDRGRRPAHGPDDVTPDPEEVGRLVDEVRRRFPEARRAALVGSHAAIKTEPIGSSSRSQSSAVFSEADHGVGGLTVLFPGKASLALRLGERLANRIAATMDVGVAR